MVIPKTSQDKLADMVDTTSSRFSFFMKKFSKPGFIGNTASCTCTVPSSISSSCLGILITGDRGTEAEPSCYRINSFPPDLAT